MPEESTATPPQDSPDAPGNNAGDGQAGAGTDTPPNPADDRKFTQAEVDAMFQKRLTKAVKAELKKLTDDPAAQPNVEELQQRATTAEAELRSYKAKDQLEDFVADKRNNVGAKNLKTVFRLVKDSLEFDDDGRVTNFKEVLAQAKAEAPELFTSAAGSINGGAGTQAPALVDMNANIRRAAGRN